MLFSMFVDPRVVSSEVVNNRDARRNVERLLRAVVENGVLIGGDSLNLVRQFISNTEQLDAGLGQQVQVLVEEIAINRRRYIAAPEARVEVLGGGDIIRLVTNLSADAVVVPNAVLKDEISRTLRPRGVEVMLVDELGDSSMEQQRTSWRAPQRLDTLDSRASMLLLGRSVRYARRVTIVERQIGACAKGNFPGLVRHMRGVAHLAEVWVRCSPYAPQGLELEIVTAGGQMGARGYISGETLRTNIQEALQRAPLPQNVRCVVTVKQDGVPPLTRDRLIEAKGRCWGVRHGFDCLAMLTAPQPAVTFIDPDGPGNRDLVTAIRRLPDVP
jgi:hypothetical protein